MVVGVGLFMASCEQDEPAESPYVDKNEPKESTLLIYSVATNSLSYDLVSDKKEMLQGAKDVDLNKNNVLIFETRFTNDYSSKEGITINLIKLVKNGDSYEWQLEKEYTDDIKSLDPARVGEVIDYVTTNYPADSYGMIFWSHSTGANPYFPTSKSGTATYDVNSDNIEAMTGENTVSLPQQYSFGSDETVKYGDAFFQVNVEELAAVVPDNLFDFIWFDSCYMGNIETLYEFKGKCNYFVGAPTEVPAYGMPYHYTLPLLARKNADLVGAADSFYRYYKDEFSNVPATIAVIEMEKLYILENFCKEVYSDYLSAPSTSSMHMYTNFGTPSFGPFYDLGDFTKAVAAVKGETITDEEWQDLLDGFIIYKAATDLDFNRKRIDQTRYSGLSTFIYRPSDSTEKEVYFESLGWYKDIFNSLPVDEGMLIED